MSTSDWALLKEYSSQLDADLDLATLETGDIPAMVRGSDIGIFGPGFTGVTPGGVRVFVPNSLLDKARDSQRPSSRVALGCPDGEGIASSPRDAPMLALCRPALDGCVGLSSIGHSVERGREAHVDAQPPTVRRTAHNMGSPLRRFAPDPP